VNVVKLEGDPPDERLNYAGWSFVGGGYYGELTDPGWSGAYTNLKDTIAEFNCPRGWVTWKTVKHPAAGITAVYKNGEKVYTFDGYAPNTEFDVTGYEFRCGSIRDTLQLVNTGTKTPDSSSTLTAIDRFVVDRGTDTEPDIEDYSVDHRRISYGSWKRGSSFGPSGNSLRVSSSPTSPLIIGPVYGSQFDLVTAMGPGLGAMLVEVYTWVGPGWPDGGQPVAQPATS
jgi:hypothetical protein